MVPSDRAARPLPPGGSRSGAAAPPRRRRGIPRPLEMVAAAAALLILSPLLLATAAALLVTQGSPLLFRQRRVGRGGRPFTLLKLRTMRSEAGGPAVTAAGDARVTPLGRLLRRAKVDELPQLWNVVRGDMALVGPRPEVPEYVDLDQALWRKVLSVRPGLTDPVTLALRDEEKLLGAVGDDRVRFYRESLQPWKLRGYAEYVDRKGLFYDVTILLRTALAIVLPPREVSPSSIVRA